MAKGKRKTVRKTVRFTERDVKKMKKALSQCSDSDLSCMIRRSTMNYVDKILKNTSGNGAWCLIECKDFIKKFISRAYADRNFNVLKEEKE